MQITSGLIIADPWIGFILDGSKVWEMRSSPTSHRGWFGLIRKGTGEVHGIARLVSCGAALSVPEMIENIDKHCITERLIRSGDIAKWVVPWEIADVTLLPEPVPYNHRSGAVIWVNLDPVVQEILEKHIPSTQALRSDPALTRELELTEKSQHNLILPSSKIGSYKANAVTASSALPNVAERLIGRSVLTAGNIGNYHFYMTGFLDQFPSNAIGGTNKASKAPREIGIDWGGPTPVFSDIDRSKRFFRRRAWIRNFFETNNAVPGDTVVVYSVAPYFVRVELEKSMPK